MAALPPWLWTAAGWTLLAAALYLLISRLIFPRKRVHRACPRCDYDMGATPTRICPECGYAALTEKHLFTKPLTRLRITAALLLALVAWFVPHTPRVVERGSVALIPGWLLAFIAPTDGSEADLAEAGVAPPPRGPMTFAGLVIYRPKRYLAGPHSPLFVEILRRLRDGELGDAAAASYLRRFLEPEITSPIPEDIETKHHTIVCNAPAAWPSDKPFNSNAADWLGPGTVTLGTQIVYFPGGRPVKHTTASIGQQIYRVQTTNVQIDVSKPSATFMSVETSPQISEAVGIMLLPILAVKTNGITITIAGVVKNFTDANVPDYGACTARILLNGDEIGRCRCDWVARHTESTAITWVADGEERARASLDQLQIEFAGDPQRAVHCYLADWRYLPIAWAGKVTVKPYISREN